MDVVEACRLRVKVPRALVHEETAKPRVRETKQAAHNIMVAGILNFIKENYFCFVSERKDR